VSGWAVTSLEAPSTHQMRTSAEVKSSKRRRTKPPVNSSSRQFSESAGDLPGGSLVSEVGDECRRVPVVLHLLGIVAAMAAPVPSAWQARRKSCSVPVAVTVRRPRCGQRSRGGTRHRGDVADGKQVCLAALDGVESGWGQLKRGPGQSSPVRGNAGASRAYGPRA
jgi:hypothetical protein